MTLCEAFRNSYLKFKETEIEERAKVGTGKYAKYQISRDIAVGTKQFVEVFFKNFDMFWDYELNNMGITDEQIKRCGKCSHCDVIFVINGETKKRTPHYFCEKDYSKEVNSDDFCHIIDKALSTIAERKENADV